MRSAHVLSLLCSCVLGCGGDSPGTSAQDMSQPSSTLLMGGNCPAPTGPGVQHTGTISSDETWSAADSPHTIPYGITVRGATLTIEPCAVVRFAAGYGMSIGGSNPGDPPAKLVAHGGFDGTNVSPVLLTADDPATYWGTLAVYASGSADLEIVVLNRAGDPTTAQNYGGALMIFGDDNRKQPVRTVHARSVLIEASATLGINVQRSGGFTADSEDVVVENCGQGAKAGGALEPTYALYVESPSVQTIPPGTYTGNVKDAILVPDPSNLDGDETFHERGVPYRFKYGYSIKPALSAAAGGLATLTIEAGVTMKLLKGSSNIPAINLGASGGSTPSEIWPVRLIAAGTSDRHITITSDAASPAAGDWGGIEFAGGPASGNVMSYVDLLYGGGDSSTLNYGCGPHDNDALLIITNWQPADAFVQSCLFSDSASGAIVSGWKGDGPNLKPANTFTRITEPCQVTQPTPVTGPCPSNGVTPDCF